MDREKPNILFMISHDTGRYLGTYGRPVETPNLDQLAENGVTFDNYFCTAPQCSPSRGSILTGLYPHRHGMMGLAHLGFTIKEGTPTLPAQMRLAGYETALIGHSHETIGDKEGTHTTSGTALGYDQYIKVDGDRAPAVAETVSEFFRSRANADKPFYASVGFFETHRDFDEYENVADPLDKSTPPDYLPDTPDVRRDFSLLHGSVKVLDSGVGEIMRSLKENGLYDNTIVVYTTDHGIAFPRAKGTLFDAGLETALIVSWPKRWAGGKRAQQLLCNVDIMPTLLETVGAPVPDGIDGQSFLPLLEGKESAGRDHFFCEMSWHDEYHPMRGIRTNQFKYIRNFESGPATYLPLDIHRSLSGQAVRNAYYEPNVPEELYDLSNDPLEQNNLAHDPQFVDVLEQLRARVNEEMQQSGDPLLQGKIPGIAAPDWQSEHDNGTSFKTRNKQGN